MHVLHTSMHSDRQIAQGQLVLSPFSFCDTVTEQRCGLRNQTQGRILGWPWRLAPGQQSCDPVAYQ